MTRPLTPFDQPGDTGIVAVTAEITLDGTRYSHTEGVTAHSWRTGGDDFREMVRTTARDCLGHGLVRELPVTITDPPADEEGAPCA
ncbi:hypothetical protein [Streptomyces sp. NPDC088847]|uniref:hypothetical protein n=1 Tax=Streptomyces sp. NPDC088847 TaxID=3365909 RepID=UPI00382A8685